MMKRLIIAIISILALFGNMQAQELILKADTAYTKADYNTALRLYKEAADSLGTGAELYYNLGNAYYRTGNIAQAIIAYERALKIAPSFSEAKENLDFVNSKIVDKPGERFSFIELSLRNIALTFSSDTWATIGLILFVILIACALTYYFTSNVALRKTGFFGGFVVLILCIISIAEAFYGKRLSTSDNEAIVTAKSTILSTSPRTPLNSNEEAMLLHEGTKVYILDSVRVESDSVSTVWYDVKVDDTHRAWISQRAIEKI